jgi:hypothetical protein
VAHYEAVIWYTADDYIPRVPNNLDTQEEEVLNFREFMNYEDGKLSATGQDLSWLSTVGGLQTGKLKTSCMEMSLFVALAISGAFV